VLKLGDRLGLAAEAGQLLGPGVRPGQQHLQGDQAIEALLPRLVNNAHAAAPQLGHDFVAGQRELGLGARPGPRRRRQLVAQGRRPLPVSGRGLLARPAALGTDHDGRSPGRIPLDQGGPPVPVGAREELSHVALPRRFSRCLSP
jgi:hypothetical protein